MSALRHTVMARRAAGTPHGAHLDVADEACQANNFISQGAQHIPKSLSKYADDGVETVALTDHVERLL